MRYLLIICVNLISQAEGDVSAISVRKHKKEVNPFPLFDVLRNEMSSNNLTFVINCAQSDYRRYEESIETFLKKIPLAYRIIHLDSLNLDLLIARYILDRMITSGDQWYDIFLLCWDDGRHRFSTADRHRPLNQLMEIFQNKKDTMGNVRWIFFTWERLLKSVQNICGVIYVSLKGGKPVIHSESASFIRKCGGRMVFFDYHYERQNLLREPFLTNATIFNHEISFQQLGSVTVLCAFNSDPPKNYCKEQPQKEIFWELSKKVKIIRKKSDATSFGKCIHKSGDGIMSGAICDGFLKDMQNRLFDLCAINIYPTQNVSMAIDFTSSYYRFDQLTFFAPPAIRIVGSFQSILMPLQNSVWLLTGLSIIISSIVLLLLTKNAFHFFSLDNSVFYVTMLFTGQCPLLPDRFRRVTSITVFLAALILANSLLLQFYAAVLTSFRQHPPTTPVIDTIASLEKVLKNSPGAIKVAVLNDTKYEAILNPREPTELMKLLKNHSTFCPNKHECVKLVTRRKHVMLATNYNLMSEIGNSPKNQAIVRAKDNIHTGSYSLPTQRGSPIANQIKNFNVKLFEGGIFNRIHDNEAFHIKPKFEVEKPLPLNSELTLNDLKGLLQLYGGCVLLSLATFVIEQICSCFLWVRHVGREKQAEFLYSFLVQPLSTRKSFQNVIPKALDKVSCSTSLAPTSFSGEGGSRTSSVRQRSKTKPAVVLYARDGSTVDFLYM